MPAVPLPKGFTAIDDFPKLRESLVNLFHTGEGLIRLPGILSRGTSSGKCRGAVRFKGKLYMVFGSALTLINDDDSTEFIGIVEGTNAVEMQPGFVFISIIVKNGRGYTYDGTTLVEITDSRFVKTREVSVIKGRTVYVPFDGEPLIFSEVNNPGVMDGFFDAEDLPDTNTGVFNFNNDLHAMGVDTIQIFRLPIGAPDNAPFSPVEGATTQVGYIGGAVLYAPSFAFIGKERDQGYSIRIMGQGLAPRISNPAIDELLTTYTSLELSNAVGASYEWKGYPILVFRLARHTLSYHAGNWFFQESTVDGADSPNPWTANYITFAYDKYYVGDATTSRFGTLEDITQEYGNDVEFSLDTFARAPVDSNFDLGPLEIAYLAGTNFDGGTMGLTMSRNGIQWLKQNTVWRELGKGGEHDRRAVWALPGGLGSYVDFAGIRLRSTAPIEFSMEALNVE